MKEDITKLINNRTPIINFDYESSELNIKYNFDINDSVEDVSLSLGINDEDFVSKLSRLPREHGILGLFLWEHERIDELLGVLEEIEGSENSDESIEKLNEFYVCLVAKEIRVMRKEIYAWCDTKVMRELAKKNLIKEKKNNDLY